MSDVRVGVIGAGYFGQFHYDAWSRIDEAEVVAVCAPPEGGGPEAAERWGIGEVFTDPAQMVAECGLDLVDITAPPVAHADLIRTLAGGVRWIICQKPFCRSLDEARKIAVLASEAGTRLAVHENVRFQPWYRELRSHVQGDLIGQPWQISFRLRPGDGQGPRAYLHRQPYFQTMERFLIHETAIHWVDTFRYLMGEIVAVLADLRRLNPAIAGEDAGLLQFTFADGARGTFDGNRLSDHAAEDRRRTMGEMEIEGPEGTLRLDGDARIWHRAHGTNEWGQIGYDWADRHFGGDCVYATTLAILTAFKADVPAETDVGAYLRNLEIEEALYRSHNERRWIDV